VVNAGVDGYDLVQEYHLARRLWDTVHPRHVIVAVYIGNDLLDYDHDSFARPPWHSRTARIWLREHSYLYHLFSGATRKWRNSISTAMTGLPGDDVGPQLTVPALLPVLRGGDEGVRRLHSTERVLEAFAALASSHCAGFTIALLPTREQVVPAHREK
jgi:hypothetical protein